MRILLKTVVLSSFLGMCHPIFAACEQVNFRQFDFWLGNWQVTNQQNSKQAHNEITLINNGCTIFEQYQTPTGYQGKSFSMYDVQTQQWHQTWVDNSGLLLKLDGGLVGTAMVMTGAGYNQQGQAIINKITWQPLANGDVQQLWQTSKDQGVSWQTVFDGLYQKTPNEPAKN